MISEFYSLVQSYIKHVSHSSWLLLDNAESESFQGKGGRGVWQVNNHQHLTNLAEKVAGAFKNFTEVLFCGMNLALVRVSSEL